jgi:hypothetical protein
MKVPHLLVHLPAHPPGRRSGRRVASLLLGAAMMASVVNALGIPAASASVTCDPGSDICAVVPDTVQTPLGPVTVEVSAGGAVTVQLAPAVPGTRVFGLPFAIPPGPPSLPGYARTTIATAGGEVDIDTIVIPPGPPSRFSLPDLVIISIHPPGPCRVSTSGTTVVFTPIYPPGPPI